MTLLVEKCSGLSENERIVLYILQELIRCGVEEFCLCPGKRNAPFIAALDKISRFKQYFWPEERSAAFFALGRSKITGKPTVVVTTSGTAAGELLPATMEAYYTGIPLILLTADRPRSFRGTNAPQTAEQVGIYGQYAVYSQDIAENEICSLKDWKRNGPLHLNVCLDEPLTQKFENVPAFIDDDIYSTKIDAFIKETTVYLDQFVQNSRFPFVVVSAIPSEAREPLVRFLLDYGAPVYLEGVSGIREDKRLSHLRIIRTDHIWEAAEKAGYPIDGILRIGGVPTFRLWRDLEDLSGKIQVCSINEMPFSGLYWGTIQSTSLSLFFSEYSCKRHTSADCHSWILEDRQYWGRVKEFFLQEPTSEAALMHQLSKKIHSDALVYLGNSLPIREWDAYADSSHSNVFASRGLSGIDGQISTFLGMCRKETHNWAIIGDLTAIFDLAAPWILQQMSDIDLNVVIINNGGGKIFERMFPLKQIQNHHQIKFKSLAELWNMQYECYTQLPEKIPYGGHRLIEIIPDEESTLRFWKKG